MTIKIPVKSILAEYSAQNLKRINEIVDKYQLTPEKLEALCTAPALTHENVQAYLNACPQKVLAELFYTTGLVKLAEIVEAKQNQLLAAQERFMQEAEKHNAPIPTHLETSASSSVPDDGKPG